MVVYLVLSIGEFGPLNVEDGVVIVVAEKGGVGEWSFELLGRFRVVKVKELAFWPLDSDGDIVGGD